MRGLCWLAAALLVVLSGCGGSSTLTAKTLRKQDDAVHSAAAEGELVATDVARDRTTGPFARIHSGDLAEQAKAVAEKLRDAEASPGLKRLGLGAPHSTFRRHGQDLVPWTAVVRADRRGVVVRDDAKPS
jgi:hypothetical protein